MELLITFTIFLAAILIRRQAIKRGKRHLADLTPEQRRLVLSVERVK